MLKGFNRFPLVLWLLNPNCSRATASNADISGSSGRYNVALRTEERHTHTNRPVCMCENGNCWPADRVINVWCRIVVLPSNTVSVYDFCASTQQNIAFLFREKYDNNLRCDGGCRCGCWLRLRRRRVHHQTRAPNLSTAHAHQMPGTIAQYGAAAAVAHRASNHTDAVVTPIFHIGARARADNVCV